MRQLRFLLADAVVAIPVSCVVCVTPVTACTRAPRTSPEIIGLAVVAGRVVCVVDIGKRIGKPAASPTVMIVVDVDTGRPSPERFGLLADAVLGIGESADHGRSPESATLVVLDLDGLLMPPREV